MSKAGSLALIFFGLFAFFNAIHHPFVHDEVVFILQDPHINDLDHWADAFKAPAVSADGLNTYYRPVLELLYRLEYHFFGPHPWYYHLFNIVVHVINGLLLFGLLQRIGLSRTAAWVIALLFLIHPVQTETVSCISGISNLMMALFILLALHAYLSRWFTACLLFFVLAFLSKEQALLFVGLVVVIDYHRGAKNYLMWLFWAAVAGILLWLRHNVTGAMLFKSIIASPGELYLRLAAVPRDLGMDLRLIFCPYDLHYYRSTDILQSNSMAWAGALISVGGIFYTLHRWPKARPAIVLGLGWFLAALLPVLNVVPLINEYSFILTPEHFLYLPIVGILIVAVCGADHFLGHFRKPVLGIVVGICLLLTWHQNTFWKSEIALFERMLQFEPDFGRGHLLLAKAYYFNGQHKRAEEHFKKAYMIMSAYAHKATNLTAEKFYLVYIKEILFDWAQNDCAMGHWARGLAKYKQAVIIDEKDASLYNNMAFVYFHLGDKKDAYMNLQEALRVDPSFTQARSNLQLLNLPSIH